jgi:hypothetical protein
MTTHFTPRRRRCFKESLSFVFLCFFEVVPFVRSGPENIEMGDFFSTRFACRCPTFRQRLLLVFYEKYWFILNTQWRYLCSTWQAIVFNEKEKSKLTTQLAAQTPILNDLPLLARHEYTDVALADQTYDSFFCRCCE